MPKSVTYLNEAEQVIPSGTRYWDVLDEWRALEMRRKELKPVVRWARLEVRRENIEFLISQLKGKLEFVNDTLDSIRPR